MKGLFLVEPQERYKEGFKKMVNEYRVQGEEEYFEMYREALKDFRGYVLKLNDNAKGIGVLEGWVPSYTYWLTNKEDEILGVVRIRTSLDNEFVRKFAGHIGYDIAPLSRRKGYGNNLLKLALQKAAMINLDRVLITCDVDNIGSKRIIESNGGIFESEIFKEEKNKQLRRYWIALGV
jgi:predicted acetyltransferase